MCKIDKTKPIANIQVCLLKDENTLVEPWQDRDYLSEYPTVLYHFGYNSATSCNASTLKRQRQEDQEIFDRVC